MKEMSVAKIFLFIPMTLVCFLFTQLLVSQNLSENSPFPLGEKLSFRVSWSNVLEAGNADLTVSSGESRSKDVLRLVLQAKTSQTLTGTYSFKDEFVSEFDVKLWAPRSFRKNFTEKTRVVDEKVDFDQLNRYAIVTQSKTGSRKIAIETGTQDPISALYALRTIALRPGMMLSFPVMDGGRTFQLDARVMAQELITTKLGSFNSHRIEVRIRPVDANSSERNIVLWFSNDQRRLPVLATIALPIGAVIIELIARTP
jgi:hypothetical protein